MAKKKDTDPRVSIKVDDKYKAIQQTAGMTIVGAVTEMMNQSNEFDPQGMTAVREGIHEGLSFCVGLVTETLLLMGFGVEELADAMAHRARMGAEAARETVETWRQEQVAASKAKKKPSKKSKAKLAPVIPLPVLFKGKKS